LPLSFARSSCTLGQGVRRTIRQSPSTQGRPALEATLTEASSLHPHYGTSSLLWTSLRPSAPALPGLRRSGRPMLHAPVLVHMLGPLPRRTSGPRLLLRGAEPWPSPRHGKVGVRFATFGASSVFTGHVWCATSSGLHTCRRTFSAVFLQVLQWPPSGCSTAWIATRPSQPGPGRVLHPLDECALMAHHDRFGASGSLLDPSDPTDPTDTKGVGAPQAPGATSPAVSRCIVNFIA